MAERKRDAQGAGSGRGRVVDISMLDCQASLLTHQAAYYLHSGLVPERQGSGHDSIPTYRSFTGKGGAELVITLLGMREMEIDACLKDGAIRAP